MCIYIYIYIYRSKVKHNAIVEPTTKKNGRKPGGGLNFETRSCLGNMSAQGSAQGFCTRSRTRHPHKDCTRLAKPCGAQGLPSAHKDFFSIQHNIL